MTSLSGSEFRLTVVGPGFESKDVTVLRPKSERVWFKPLANYRNHVP